MRALAAGVLVIGLSIPAWGDGHFEAVVRNVESQFGVRKMRIPLFGVVKFFVRAARPVGVKQLDVAIFEDLRLSRSDMEDFDAAVTSALGGAWRPMVRVRERGETTCIYAQPDGKDLKLLVATTGHDDTVLVEVKVNPERLARMLDESPRRAGKCFGSGSDRCSD